MTSFIDQKYGLLQHEGKWKILDGDYFMINIYSPQDSSAKATLWNRIDDFMRYNNGAFVLFGDLNENLDVKIESNTASLKDRESRPKLLHEIDKIDRLETLDLHQKSRIKWDIEGEEIPSSFMVLSIKDVEQILFMPHDSMIELPSIMFPSNLSSSDHDLLEKDVTLE
ncbi:hypothetical protein Tco_0867576 [Tanacetum coccineum]